jgi:hypothetical protein
MSDEDYNKLSLDELAARILIHLERFAADPETARVTIKDRNDQPKQITAYWSPRAFKHGRFLRVCYVSYQGDQSISRVDAAEYLAWLDQGNVGKHFKLAQ